MTQEHERINATEISLEEINKLSDWCKNNEFTSSQFKEHLTPRTEYAIKLLGLDFNDISSENHQWTHDKIAPSSPKRELLIANSALKVEKYMFWYYLSKNLKTLQVMRQKIIDENLIDSDKKNEEKLDQEMIEKIIKKSNEEFENFIQINRKQLNQLFNEQKLKLNEEIKRKEQKEKEREKEIRKEAERIKREKELKLKREKEKEKAMKILKEKEYEALQRELASMKWLEQNKKHLKEKRLNEFKRQQRTQQKRLNETEQYKQKRNKISKKKFNERIEKTKKINKYNDSHYKIWIKNNEEKKKYFKNKVQKRQKIHEQRLKKMREMEEIKIARIKQEKYEKEIRQKEFRRSRSMKLLKRAKTKELRRKSVIAKSHSNQNLFLVQMLEKQKEADQRREEFQLKRQKEAKMKQTMYKFKKNETIERMKRLQRAKEFENNKSMEKMILSDRRYNKQKNLENAILSYKLKSNDTFKEEKQKQLDLGNKYIQNQDIKKINNLIKSIDSQNFGIEKLNVDKIKKMTSRSSDISGSNTARTSSSTCIFKEKTRQKIRYQTIYLNV